MSRKAIKTAMATLVIALVLLFNTAHPAAAAYPAWQLYVDCGGAYHQVKVSGPNQHGGSETWYGWNNGSGIAATHNYWWASYSGGVGYVSLSTRPNTNYAWTNHGVHHFQAQPGSWSSTGC